MRKKVVMGFSRNLYGQTFSSHCLAVTPKGTHLDTIQEIKVQCANKTISTGNYILRLEDEKTPVILIQDDWIGSFTHGSGILKIWDPYSRKGFCTKDFSLRDFLFEDLQNIIKMKGKPVDANGWFPIIDI